MRYQALRPDDGALRERLKALAQERRRFGYRRLHVLLRREGHAVNKKRVQRIYRETPDGAVVAGAAGHGHKAADRDAVGPTSAESGLRFRPDTDGRRFTILSEIDT